MKKLILSFNNKESSKILYSGIIYVGEPMFQPSSVDGQGAPALAHP